MEEYYKKSVDASENYGSKGLCGNGLKRMYSFLDWSFNRPEQTIIAGGHSLYFKNFFKTFLTTTEDFPLTKKSKKNKMYNAGIVGFTVVKTEKGFYIKPES